MKLIRSEFRQYLQANRTTEFERDSCDLCPIAGFLLHKTQADEVEVNDNTFSVGDKLRPLPPWAERFVRDWDADSSSPTGAAALDLL